MSSAPGLALLSLLLLRRRRRRRVLGGVAVLAEGVAGTISRVRVGVEGVAFVETFHSNWNERLLVFVD